MVDLDVLQSVAADLPAWKATVAALCAIWCVLFIFAPRETMFRTVQLALVLDQVFNVVAGSGWADELYSAYAHRRKSWERRLVNGLFFWQRDHCKDAYEGEVERRQLPPIYRNNVRSDR